MRKAENRKSFHGEELAGQTGEELLQSYIEKVIRDSRGWDCRGINVPWFRGQTDGSRSPVPAVFRSHYRGQAGRYDEYWLSAIFRNRAPAFGETPENRDDLDKWLFLMQHVGIPTRLLDWTESALAALFFAVHDQEKETDPAVWMLNPIALNHVALGFDKDLRAEAVRSQTDCYPNTWTRGSMSYENIRLAFLHPAARENCRPSQYPLAIQLTYCHPRMSAQKGCFTVHGAREEGFEEIFDEDSALYRKNYFRKYTIKRQDVPKIYERLKTFGITHSTIYPDIYGLARELQERFWHEE